MPKNGRFRYGAPMGHRASQDFESSRRFQVWLYTVSHAQLLLRSTKTGDHATRIDLLFKNVRSLNLPTATDGLRVREVERGVYQLNGPDWQGLIEAEAFFDSEDEGEYHEPSPFQGSLPGDV